MLSRRTFAASLLAAAGRAEAGAPVPAQGPAQGPTIPAPVREHEPGPLVFPFDFGAHPERHVEWWYVTGALDARAAGFGFQITFFRVATGLASGAPSRFAASEIVFAHAALTDLEGRRLRHDQRIARAGFGIAEAATGETRVGIRDWALHRSGAAGPSRYAAKAASSTAGFAFELALEATQPLLLQGVGGLSQKGPAPAQVSRYYSEPQLAARGTVTVDGRRFDVSGRAWLDHEWSDSYLDADAVGWDWIGMNLDDGSALMAFRMRRTDGGTLWTGGSHRPRGGSTRNFEPGEVAFRPLRTWQSARSNATYPVEWDVVTPAGRFTVRALQDDQELDSRASTGAIYWEGLSALVDARGRQVGRGYLEMTGYAARLVL